MALLRDTGVAQHRGHPPVVGTELVSRLVRSAELTQRTSPHARLPYTHPSLRMWNTHPREWELRHHRGVECIRAVRVLWAHTVWSAVIREVRVWRAAVRELAACLVGITEGW